MSASVKPDKSLQSAVAAGAGAASGVAAGSVLVSAGFLGSPPHAAKNTLPDAAVKANVFKKSFLFIYFNLVNFPTSKLISIL
jgi:hypothetical protein